MNNIIEIFPTAIGKYELMFTDEEFAFVNNLKRINNISNFLGDDFEILKQKKLSRLKTFFKESLNNYLETVYCPKQKFKLKITQSWVNYTEPNQQHHEHMHGNSFISGVYYFKTLKNNDGINFYNLYKPIIDFGFIDFVRDFNKFNASETKLLVHPGLLYLFPSRLVHSTETNNENDVRISLSFNTFFKGKIGNKTRLTYLDIK